MGDNVYDDRGYEALVGAYYGPWVAAHSLLPAVGNHDHEEGIGAFDAFFLAPLRRPRAFAQQS